MPTLLRSIARQCVRPKHSEYRARAGLASCLGNAACVPYFQGDNVWLHAGLAPHPYALLARQTCPSGRRLVYKSLQSLVYAARHPFPFWRRFWLHIITIPRKRHIERTGRLGVGLAPTHRNVLCPSYHRGSHCRLGAGLAPNRYNPRA